MKTPLSRYARHLAWSLLCVTLAACGSGSDDSGAKLAVTGAVAQPGSYTTSGLSTLPQVTQTVSFASSTGSQTHIYTGPTLWNVLGNTTIQTDSSVKNDVLNKYVLASASDGYRVVFSLGEINPDFGNRTDLVAIQETVNGSTGPLVNDGYFRITAPGDTKGGRYVSLLTSLDVRASGSTVAGIGGGTSSQFAVSGNGAATSGTWNAATLAALPQTTVTVGSSTYTGVNLWTFLNSAVGLATRSAVKNDDLALYVVATGADGYKTVISVGEIDSGFGNQPDLIALQLNGASLGSTGFARLVIPNDVKGGRWVSNLIALEVVRAP